MTADEHVEWAKERALEYVDAGQPMVALTSLTSDLRKHPATCDHLAIEFGMMLVLNGHMNSARDVREWIEGVR